MSRRMFAMLGVLVLLGHFVLPAIRPALARDTLPCPDKLNVGYVCRVFEPKTTGVAGQVDSFKAVTYLAESRGQAHAIISERRDSVSGYAHEEELAKSSFASEQSLMIGTRGNTDIAILMFRQDALAMIWTVTGDSHLLFGFLESVYGSVVTNPTEHLLPSLENLPDGFKLADEETYDGPSAGATEEAPTRADLEATIAALEKQLEDKDNETSPKGENETKIPQPERRSEPVDILDVTTKDAGIGDGTVYVYVDLRNTTSQTLDYVQVDITCRDSGGRVVATGIANTLDLGAGQSTVLTGIVMSAPTCDAVDVSVSPLTGGF